MIQSEKLNTDLTEIKKIAYDSCSLLISNFTVESESQEYKACKFQLNGNNIIYRHGKITPKKVGQFVTFWKRNEEGITEAYKEIDEIDYYIITVVKDNRIGQFVLPKSVLIEKGILSTSRKDGKRGFRVYPIWDAAKNQQAKKTQKWQLNYFVEFYKENALELMTTLLEKK